MAAVIGTGTTLTYSGFSPEILSVDWSDRAKETVQSSHMGTTNDHTFISAKLTDPGTVTAEFLLDGAQAFDALLHATSSVSLTVNWGGTAKTTAASAYLISVTQNAPLEDRMTGTAVFKCTGAVTEVTV